MYKAKNRRSNDAPQIFFSPWVPEYLDRVFPEAGEIGFDTVREFQFMHLLTASCTSFARSQGFIDLKKFYQTSDLGESLISDKTIEMFGKKSLSRLGVEKTITVENGCTVMVLRFKDGSEPREYKMGKDFNYERTFLELLRKVSTQDYGFNIERKGIINELLEVYDFSESVERLRALEIKPAQAITVLNGERASRRQSGTVDKLLKKSISHSRVGLPSTYDKFIPLHRGGRSCYLFTKSTQFVVGTVLHPGGGKMSSNSSACFDHSFIVDPLFNGPPRMGFRGTLEKFLAREGREVYLDYDNVASDACGYITSVEPALEAKQHMKSMHPAATNNISASILQSLYDLRFQSTMNSRGKKRRIVLKCALEHDMARNKIFNKFRYTIMSKQRAPNLEVVLDCFDPRYLKNKNYGVDIKEIESFVSATTYAGCLTRLQHSQRNTAPTKKFIMENKLPDAVCRIFKENGELPEYEPLESLNYFRKQQYLVEDEMEQIYPCDDEDYVDIFEELELGGY